MREGIFSSVDFPNTDYTWVNGINDFDQIVGGWWKYVNDSIEPHGFLLEGSNFDDFGYRRFPGDINDKRKIVGHYLDGDSYRGFLLGGKKLSPIDFPGAANTYVNGINNYGYMVGEYRYSDNISRGFIFDGKDLSNIGVTSAIPYGINDAGQIVGYFWDGDFLRGFLITGDDFIPIDFPGADATRIYGINNSGQIVGRYSIGGYAHVFLGTPLPLSEITEILDFFDNCVETGTLIGVGPSNLAAKRLNSLRAMIEIAGNLLEVGDYDAACQQLQSAFERCDGLIKPKDFVVGDATSELAGMIDDLMTSRGCQ